MSGFVQTIGVCGICRGPVSQPIHRPGIPAGEPASCSKCGAQAKSPFPVLEMVEPKRCLVTGNHCGTDTWESGYACNCGACRAYVGESGELPAELLDEVALKFLARRAKPGSSREPRVRTSAVTAHDIADFIRDCGHARVVTIDEAGNIGFAPAWMPATEPIPTIETIADTRARLLDLTSRRLIQFVDARNEALRLLDPPVVDGVRRDVDLVGAIRVLKATKELR